MSDVDEPYNEDLFEACQWAAWKARAKLDKAIPGYSDTYFDEEEEIALFEAWRKRIERNQF